MQWELSGMEILKCLIIHGAQAEACSAFPRRVCLSLSTCSYITQAVEDVCFLLGFFTTAQCCHLSNVCIVCQLWPMAPPFSGSVHTERNVYCNEIIIFCYPLWVVLWFSAKRNYKGKKAWRKSSTFNLIGVTFLPPLWYFNSPICLHVAWWCLGSAVRA